MLFEDFKPVKVMSEQEVKDELARLNSKRIVKGLFVANGLLTAIAISPRIDIAASSVFKSFGRFLYTEHLFLDIIPVANIYTSIFVLAVIAFAIERIIEIKKGVER